MEKQESLPLDKSKIKSIAESLLFVNEKPIEIAELSEILSVDKRLVEEALEELVTDYTNKPCGISIVKVAGGFQMCSSPESEMWIKKMYRERGKQKLSVASLETLAIISYKQPITRMEIESIRGVNIDGVMKHLADLGLIKIEGRKEVPGKPFLYVTTRKFLEYFGLNALKDLPKLEEFMILASKEETVQANAEENSNAQPIEDKAVLEEKTLEKNNTVPNI
ncbi:MAG: SMC-Scp complex subunit ScpB [Candidatus Omnitrophica bacterium]|jgi:segregation and condensation protein B|nr:SMC-Scp complex subunit ScpB [Candidatus Omnitrophota bacterium]